MNWIKRKVIKWVKEDQDNVREDTGIAIRSRDFDAAPYEEDPILNFRVFSAVGGQVVEFRRYDRKTDRSESTTYIIHKDDDFGDKIAKVANLEMLK
jgi:hypothetical protein